MKFQGVSIQPVPLPALRPPALQPRLRINVQQKCQVWCAPAGGQARGALQLHQIQLVAVALVRQAGVIKAVAQDHAAARQLRLNYLAHQLCARGAEKQKLRLRLHAGTAVVQQQLAHLVANRRAARLARVYNRMAGGGQCVCQLLRLRCFAAALRPLKAYKQAHSLKIRTRRLGSLP